jgi:aldehyde:ferredoxin oxidoreductase
MIKRTGFDYITITGKSDRPVYLHITPQGVSFEDASSFWGMGIFEVEKKIKSLHPKARIASIGPAGENRVRFACIGTDYYRQFGRGGAGAVMGAKNLKAVVLEGNEKIDFFDKDKFLKLNSQLTSDIMAHPNRAKRYDLGTTMWVRMGQEEGQFLPTRNFKDVQFEEFENITSESMKKKLNWKSVGCFNCVIQCAKMASWKKYEVEGPEYETTAFLGSGCGIGDPEAVAYSNYICDDLGLDTISAGVVASFAMEAFERGILSREDCDGLNLEFGNSQAQFSLLEKMAARDGIGDLLAEGSRIASQKLGQGSEYFAIQTAGMELSGVNIKGCASMGLTLATADFASHTRFWSASAEMAGSLTFENTPDFVISGQDEVNARNSLVICDFVPFGFDRLAPVYESLTGIQMDESRFMKIGEKISNVTRMVNMKNGRTRKDDTLPQRFFKEEHLSGIFKGKIMSEEIFSQWLDVYYKKRGWDREGVPTEDKLKELGLKKI